MKHSSVISMPRSGRHLTLKRAYQCIMINWVAYSMLDSKKEAGEQPTAGNAMAMLRLCLGALMAYSAAVLVLMILDFERSRNQRKGS